MSQSLSKMFVHIVFSTKFREKTLPLPIQPEIWKYIGGICKNLECIPVQVGGHSDHVHILCIMSKKIALMDLIKEIKTGSSLWIKTKGEQFRGFHWQDGYGGFSVSPNEAAGIVQYIQHQAEHHEKRTFKDEYREFLRLYEVEFNERYVWD